MKNIIVVLFCFLIGFVNVYSQHPDSLWKPIDELPSNPGARFEDMIFFDKTSGFGIDLFGLVFWSKNGERGITTVFNDAGVKQTGTRCIAFQSREHGWIGTLDSLNPLMETIDSGKTWHNVTLPEPKPSGICGMWALNDKILFGCGAFDIGFVTHPYGRAVFVKTTDGGKSFTTKDMSSYALTLVDCYFTTPENGLVTGSVDGKDYKNGHAVILATDDGGLSWKTVYKSTRIGEQGWKIYFRTATEGYVALQSPMTSGDKYIAKTTDGGKTWKEVFLGNASMKGFPQGVCFVDEQNGIVGGYGDTVFATSNGGVSWTKYGSRVIYSMNRSRKLDDTTAYIIASQVHSFRKSPVTGVSEIERKSPFVPYPNPSTEAVTIAMPFDGLCWVKIFNSRGKAIDAVIADNYVRIPTHLLPNGMYVVVIESRYGIKTEKFMVER